MQNAHSDSDDMHDEGWQDIVLGHDGINTRKIHRGKVGGSARVETPPIGPDDMSVL